MLLVMLNQIFSKNGVFIGLDDWNEKSHSWLERTGDTYVIKYEMVDALK